MDSDRCEGSVLLDYLPKLVRLAERNMSAQLRQKCGADDMADSILASIVRMDRNDRLPLCIEQSEAFWRYLVAVSLQKIRKKARFYKTKKREVGSEQPLRDVEPFVRGHRVPSQEGADRVADLLEQARGRLDDQEQDILAGRLAGKTNAEIAETLNDGQGRSTKTVSRKWKRIEEVIRKLAIEMEDP